MANMTQQKKQLDDTINRAWFNGEVMDWRVDGPSLEVTEFYASPIEIRHSRTISKLVWRRSLSHIREDDQHSLIIWLVLNGTMKITGPNGVHVLAADTIALMTFDVPFIVESENGPDEALINLVINVPAAMIQPELIDQSLGIPYAANSSDGRMAQKLFMALIEEGEGLAHDMALRLATSAVQCVCNVLRTERQIARSPSKAAAGIEQIIAFISANISDPELSGDVIAAGCGMSRRQLHYFLKRNDQSLTKLVWGQRLQNVADWLREPDMANVPISELAYAAGLKNYEHFSRAFKAMFGTSPRQYRIASQSHKA